MTPATRPRTSARQAPRKIERFFSRLDDEGWIVDRPEHVYVVAADGTGAVRNLTPGPFQHDGVSWLPDSSAVVTSAQRHDTWDRDLCADLYVVPLEGEVRALTKETGQYLAPVGLARRTLRRLPRSRRHDDVSAECQGRGRADRGR